MSFQLSACRLASCNSSTSLDKLDSIFPAWRSSSLLYNGFHLFSGTTSTLSRGYPFLSRPFTEHNILWNSLAIRSRIRSRSVSRDVLSNVSTSFCVFPLLAAPSYVFSICHMSWLWLVFSFSANWEPSRWRRWFDKHWRVSTCLDVWIDWLPSEHFPSRALST